MCFSSYMLYEMEELPCSMGREHFDFNTVNPSCPQVLGWISWSIPDEANVRTPPKIGRYWEIHPLLPQDFPGPSGLRKSVGLRGWLPHFGRAWIQCSRSRALLNFTMGSHINANASENKYFPLVLWHKVSEKGALAAAGNTLKKTTRGQDLVSLDCTPHKKL